MANIRDYEQDFSAAIEEFWQLHAAGSQAAAHLVPVQELTRQVLHDAGVPEEAVFTGTGQNSTAPGWVRTAKDFDVVVLDGQRIVLIVEMKSQVGAYGKNFNNRIEEAMGQRADYNEVVDRLLGGYDTWFGYVMVVSEDDESTRAGRTTKTYGPMDPVFQDASYEKRYSTAFARMRDAGHLDASVMAMSPRELESMPASQLRDEHGKDVVRYPDPDLSFQEFAKALHGRVSAYRRACPDAWVEGTTPEVLP